MGPMMGVSMSILQNFSEEPFSSKFVKTASTSAPRLTDVHSELCQIYKLELSPKRVNGFHPSTIFAKNSF